MNDSTKRKLPLPIIVSADHVTAGESVHDPSFSMSDRTDGFHKLLYVRAGRVLYAGRLDPKPIVLGPGTACLVPAGRCHRLEDETPATLLLLGLGTAWIEAQPIRKQIFDRISGRHNRVLMPDVRLRHVLESGWRSMLAEQIGGKLGWKLAISAEADRILIELARSPDLVYEPHATKRVQQVGELVKQRCYEPWDLDGAAKKADLSRRHFSQLFKAAFGQTFVAYLTEMRLLHASRLLEGGRHSIAGVAFSCGFGDLAHFYRVFRRKFGSSPGAWKQ